MVRVPLSLPETRVKSQKTPILAIFFLLFLFMAYPTAQGAGIQNFDCRKEAFRATNAIRRELRSMAPKVVVTSEVVCGISLLSKGDIGVVSAARSAILSFLNDPLDEESPLALAIEAAFEQSGLPVSSQVPAAVMDDARAILIAELASARTTIRLVAAGEEAEHGEISGPNWIFRMTAKGLSDHVFWAVVDRTGHIHVYNYGFN
jgi:hypothetical protein